MTTRTIRWVYDCGPQGEIEGMFDESGELLGAWSNNDASWRQEYFEPFMESLGITVLTSDKKALVNKLRRHFR